MSQAYREALGARDIDAMASAMAADVVLNGPIAPQQHHGPDEVIEAMGTALGVLQGWELVEVIEGDELDVLRFEAKVSDDARFQVVQLVKTGPDGLVKEIRGFTRPLKVVVAWAQAAAPQKDKPPSPI